MISTLVAIYQKYMRRHIERQGRIATNRAKRAKWKTVLPRDAERSLKDEESNRTQVADRGNSLLAETRSPKHPDQDSYGRLSLSLM